MPRTGWILLAIIFGRAGHAENILANSSFDLAHGRGTAAASWRAQLPPPVEAERADDVARTGSHSFRLRVPDGAEVSWYQVYQELPAPRGATTLALSAWVRTQGARDGHGAYLSLSFYDALERRTGYFDSPPLRGDQEWSRLTSSGAPPPGSTTMRAVILVHGHGTAWFDDVQLEAGETATDYAPSPADARARARIVGDQAEAKQFLGAADYHRQPGRNVAVLDAALPAKGKTTSAADIAAALEPAGYLVTRIGEAQLANEALLQPDRFDLLVLPCAEAFPARAHQALVGYLAGGGCYLSMGGYAFDRPLVQVEGKWYAPDELPAGESTLHGSVAEFDPPRPVARESDDPHALEVGVVASDGADGHALRLHTPALHQWATAVLPVDLATLPAGWSRTRLRARADRDGTSLILEWSERDQSRWQKTLELTTQWQELTIGAGDLACWHDSPAIGRGGEGDRFHPEDAARMMFGFSVDRSREGSELGAEIDWVRVEDDPYVELRGGAPHINTRYGHIRDAMFPDPEQIGAFDPSHPLLEVAATKAAPDQYVLPPDVGLAGELSGLVATCMLTTNGHGFEANRCRRVSLLEASDAQGNPRGSAMALAYHHSGFYQGSAWGFCGVDNRDPFGTGGPLHGQLPAIAGALLRRVFLHDFDAEYACYRPGETMTVRSSISDFGLGSSTGELRLTVAGKEAGRTPVELKPGESREVEWSVPVGDAAPFIDLRVGLVQDGKVVDTLRNGVVVWRDPDVAKGPPVGIRNALLTFRGRTQFLIGSQLWWGTTQSVTARSPLQFRRDLEQMHTFGFHILRAFLRMDTEQQRRISDAIVALAAANDVVVFHTPNLMPTAPAEDYARWPDEVRKIADRYRGAPNVVVDLCNEPRVSAEEGPDLTAPWNAFLRARYGDVAALRRAWGDQAPVEELGSIPLPQPVMEWGDVPTADLFAFLVAHHREWARDLTQAIHEVDPKRLVSVGYLPGHGWAGNLVVPQVASLDLDFTDRHFYGEIHEFPAQNAWIDERLLGKPTSIGEFGARNHPGFGDLYEDTPTYNHRFEYLVHHAFGMGGSFACSWHWRDPMEGIFAFGQVHADNVPRPVAALMTKMAEEFGALDRSGKLPTLAVMLPTEHLLGGARQLLVPAIERCFDTLLGLHAPFAVIADVELAKLPPTVDKLFCPLPYVLTDETYQALLAFVRRGGAVVITGDLRYTPSRVPAAGDRLAELCGVTLTNAQPPLDLSHAPAVAVEAPDGKTYQVHPVGKLEATAAEGYRAVAFRNQVGAGRVFYIGAPLELEREADVSLRLAYDGLLDWLKAERIAVEPDLPEIHVFPIELADGGRRYLIWNEGPERTITVQTPNGPVHAEVAEKGGALL